VIQHAHEQPTLPKDHRGYAWLPSGRVVFWTGKLAIGLRYSPSKTSPAGHGMEAVQSAMTKAKQ
jgi:hypothetical protein